VDLLIPVYLITVGLACLTIAWSASLAKRSGQRPYRVFFYFVIVNDLVSLIDVLFRFLPSRVGPQPGGIGMTMTAFLVFPLMAAFSALMVDFELALLGLPFPKLLKRVFIGYWGLLFIGFLAAEIRLIAFRDVSLTNILMPFFDAAILASGIGSALFVVLRARAVPAPDERRFIRTVSGYLLVMFVVFGLLFYGPRFIPSNWNVLVRSLLGFAYLLPLLIWLRRRLMDEGNAALTRLAGLGAELDLWLEARGLSPRERQIVRCVLEGKTNKTIEQELFIGRRTVESHLYSIYRKMGVKNRLQLARLTAAEVDRANRS
jgi:DNA-binding CsgD family transcriptional regulator